MSHIVPSRRAVALWSLFFHGVSIFMAFASGVLLVPLYLKYVSSELYGAWSASGNVLAWMGLIDPGVSAVLQQRVASFYGKQDLAGVGQWIGNGVLISFAVSLVVAAIGYWVSFHFASWMHLPASVDAAVLVHSFRWAVLGTALMFFFYALSSVWIGLQGSWGMGLISAFGSVARFIVVIIFLKTGFGLQSLVIPNVLLAVFLIVAYSIGIGVRLQSENIQLALSFARCKEMAGLFSFTSLARIASTLITQVDLLWIVRVLGPEQVNVLRFMRTPTSMVRLFVERPFQAVSAPLTHLYGSGDVDRARAVLVRMLRASVWVIGLCAGGFLVYTKPFINLWVGPQYYAGHVVNVWIVSGYVISLVIGILSSVCYSAGNIRGNSLANVIQAAVYIPLLIGLGYFWGMAGIAAATTLSVVLIQGVYQPVRFVQYYRVKRSEWLPIVFEGAKALGVAAVLVVVFQRWQPATWVSFISYGFVFCCAYGALLLSVSAQARGEGWHGYRLIEARVPSQLKRRG